MTETVSDVLEEREDRALEDLQTLLAQPSISATGEGIDGCAQLVRRLCLEQVPAGIDIELTRVASMAPQRTPADSPVVEPARGSKRVGD